MTSGAALDLTGPGRRRQRTAERLRDALARLVAAAGQGTGPSDRDTLTVAALSRLSGVGRNAIYSNHRFALEELARARLAAAGETVARRDRLTELRVEVDSLKCDKNRLVTENAGLLLRTLDAEAAVVGLKRQIETLQQALRQSRDAPAPDAPDVSTCRS